TGGLMLSINGLHNFYYLPELHDMRCKAQRICEIIRGRSLLMQKSNHCRVTVITYICILTMNLWI
ncbi:hypothetical protein, partial [Bacteroides caecigallinarum]|uniref:hypothetical protein n=1 Tax=Bacteroides caecigallinarum TaxID=1411144 RepID=UPI001EF41922